MSRKRPTTIPAYIKAAPREGRQHLRKVYAILKRAAPKAQETIKWGTPFFVEPRFLFAFSGHKAHLNFFATQPGEAQPFRKELVKHRMTKAGMLQVPYDEPLPEALIRKIAERRVRDVSKRKDGGFW
jgi:uncharacterized protein YdhG (YjbR/CyaY superfamily)